LIELLLDVMGEIFQLREVPTVQAETACELAGPVNGIEIRAIAR
jgi:hypothetical protein